MGKILSANWAGSLQWWGVSVHRRGSAMNKRVHSKQHLFNKLLNDSMSGRPSAQEPRSPPINRLSPRHPEMCCLLCITITELRVNVNEVWSNQCDWRIKYYFVAATSTIYSTCIAPCFVPIAAFIFDYLDYLDGRIERIFFMSLHHSIKS